MCNDCMDNVNVIGNANSDIANPHEQRKSSARSGCAEETEGSQYKHFNLLKSF